MYRYNWEKCEILIIPPASRYLFLPEQRQKTENVKCVRNVSYQFNYSERAARAKMNSQLMCETEAMCLIKKSIVFKFNKHSTR